MERPFPEIHWHLDSLASPAEPAVTERFRSDQDYDLTPLVADLLMERDIHAYLSTLKAHAEQLHRKYMKVLPVYADADYDLEVLIRLVGKKLLDQLPEVEGIQGIMTRAEPSRLLLLCATPDMPRLKARFTHEFGHYLRFVSGPAVTGGELSNWLLDELLAEQLVKEYHGTKYLTHSRSCPGSYQIALRDALAQEEDSSVDQKIRSLLNERESAMQVYAFVNSLVRQGWWTSEKLLGLDTIEFREQLIEKIDGRLL